MDGETLSSISDDSVDFVIANHMIEHCQNQSLRLKFLESSQAEWSFVYGCT